MFLLARIQLDVLGLIPDVSGPDQVRKAAVKVISSDKQSIGLLLEIGGHRMPCMAEFISGKLALLVCGTGKNMKNYPTEASNTEIHSDLVDGFTKKFGDPNEVEKIPVRTNMGVEHTSESAAWEDKKGNTLSLVSMIGRVDAGLMSLRSSEYLKRVLEEIAAEEAKKKF